MKKILIALATLTISASPLPASENTLYECELLESVYASQGKLNRVPLAMLVEMTPLTIDLESGVVRAGVKSRVSRWRVVQKPSDIRGIQLDWVLKREKGRSPWWDRADDVIRIRLAKEMAATVVYYFSGNFYTGTCKALD